MSCHHQMLNETRRARDLAFVLSRGQEQFDLGPEIDTVFPAGFLSEKISKDYGDT